MIFGAEKAKKDFGDKVSDSEKEEVEKLIKETKDALEKDDTDEIKKASEKLSEKVMEVSSKVYQSQAEASQILNLKKMKNLIKKIM